MLTHIVCWKYKPETTEAQREDHIAKLKALPTIVPNIISFSAGHDILRLDRSYDSAIVVVFPDQDALDAYAVHPEHVKVVNLGREIAANAISVDFVD